MDELELARDELGRLLPGQVSLNPNGRPKDTEEVKLLRKTAKEIIAEYKEALAEALPMIKPVIIAKALEGDMTAIKEIHDRTMDKSKQPTDIEFGVDTIKAINIMKNYGSNDKPITETN